MEAERRKLPIGIQTFREIREGGYYYADKTGHIRQLTREGKHFFLSRPRRFGKSLLLDTIKELFEGSEALFRGLAIHECWNWGQRHPVVRLSFGRGDFTSPDYVHETTTRQIAATERRAELHGDPGASAPERFAELIAGLFERSGERARKGAALQQLAARGYAEKYRNLGEPILLVGIEFSEATRNISAFDVAEA